MRSLCLAVLVGLEISVAASGQAQPRIEIRKVRTLADQDGRGFSRAPMNVKQLFGARYALSEMNVMPLVVDSTGRLFKPWVKGEGPGELEGMSTFAVGRGDTLYVASMSRVSVFDRNLKFVRSFALPTYAGTMIATDSGFIISSQRRVGPRSQESVVVLDREGHISRSFLKDTLIDRTAHFEYRLAEGSGNTVWASSLAEHRLERWTFEGTRRQLIDTTPAWFSSPDPRQRASIRSAREASGVLWVLSSVPVPDASERVKEALKGARGESDARLVPFESLATAHLEAYDAATGRYIADLPIKAYPVAIVDDRHMMFYTLSATDTPQLEIWEFTIKR